MKKKYSHSCNMPNRSRKSNKIRKKMASNVSKKALTDVYNRFYRDQVTALYRVIADD
ncbi:MAG: hypothetical protein GF409_01200 [Candidatus Omnitrophica bacterium]|nr:hypothetical protein [Candidatus Omnitrophota bacterium]